MPATQPPLFPFDNSYARELQGLYVPWQPEASPAPHWLKLNTALAQSLGLNVERLAGTEGLTALSGQAVPEGASPLAQAYAGHQFGGFSPQLGDGRALLLGEMLAPNGQRLDMAFKGSGPTPFSRGGDGKAAMGPVLREYLISEAMHALGIPTTRTLAAVATGETVRRERPLPGALLVRTAASHIRVGTFQFFAARHDTEKLQRLLNHVIARHCPETADATNPALAVLSEVMDRQAKLVAQWMGVGFIHGVMNTDNTTLSGETIDYGPCAFMEAHAPDTVFSSIDHHGRYAYGNQPGIAQWNLARLAEALLPLMPLDPDDAVAQATDLINTYPALYQRHWLSVLQKKLGMDETGLPLANDYLALLNTWQVDHTLGFRTLSDVLRQRPQNWQALWGDGLPAAQAWLDQWLLRLQRADLDATAERMDQTNPLVIPRNHLVEAALTAATEDHNLRPFEQLLGAITQPFNATLAGSVWARPGDPEQTTGYRTFCGT